MIRKFLNFFLIFVLPLAVACGEKAGQLDEGNLYETSENESFVEKPLVDDSATVKTFYKEKGYIRLQPENDEMEPIIVDNCTILGKVFGIFRKMS